MAEFAISPAGFDGAFCTVDTFRHLLTESAAEKHLVSVAAHLRKHAVYVLGMHLLPVQGVTTRQVRWKNSRGRLEVKTTMTVLDVDRRRRLETLRMALKVSGPTTTKRYQSVYSLRTYTLRQFRQLLERTGVFEIQDCFDDTYDLSRPCKPHPGSEYVIFLLRNIG